MGQALNSAWWTREIAADPKGYPRQSSKIGGKPRKAGIILVCLRPRPREQTCIDHYIRLYRLLEEQKLPVTLWYCSAEENKALGDCQTVDFPEKKPLPINPPLPTKKLTPVRKSLIHPPLPTKKPPVRKSEVPVPKSPGACCHTCRDGKACGDTCIARAKECHKPHGCACDE